MSYNSIIDDTTHWLTPREQNTALEALLGFGILKWDNKRKLPLKSGGETDVYINQRACRSTVGATQFLADCFANPLRRLLTEQFVEMPSALSGVAGVLQGLVGVPYVTIRDVPKQGRVSDAEIIGDLVANRRTTFFDDVVTDGETKIGPYHSCLSRGVKPQGLVVLVDRQQGWRKKFAAAGVDMPVWSGMTLHDVRRFLIEGKIMKRCDPAQEAKNNLIIALDGKPWEDVLSLIDPLRPTGCILKANDLLTRGDFVEIIRALQVYGRVMADPKWHDTPSTLGNYCSRLREAPPWAVTVHASGGRPMIKTAVEALAGTDTIILAVTVLTSIGAECEEIYGRMATSEVKRLAKIAWEAGARGFVCSADEAAMLRELYPTATIVVPGLSSSGVPLAGQQRAATFIAAMDAGGPNTFCVAGRQVTNSANPLAEAQRIMAEELGIKIEK